MEIGPVTLGRFVAFFGKTNGRDKLAKLIQNYCRYQKFYAQTDEKRLQFKKLQNSLSEFRSIIKFFKPLGNLEDAQEIMAQTSQSPMDMLKLTSLACDTGYKFGDNIEYLSTYRVLPFDPEKMERFSKMFQFWAYVIDVVVGFQELAAMKPENYKDEETFRRARSLKMIGFIGDFADLLRVTPGYLAMMQVPGWKKHDGFSGVMGVIVGVIGCYKVWRKCK